MRADSLPACRHCHLSATLHSYAAEIVVVEPVRAASGTAPVGVDSQLKNPSPSHRSTLAGLEIVLNVAWPEVVARADRA